MTVYNIVSIDLGASSGRVMLAKYHLANNNLSKDRLLKEHAVSGKLVLQQIHRFSNILCKQGDHCCWDLVDLEKNILLGLRQIISQNIRIDSIGIDTWGVDYVLLDSQGQQVGPSYAYRDHRTQGVMAQVQQELGSELIYQHTGIQFLPFNTLYQLKAMVDEQPEWLPQVAHWLMIPDYLNYRLTGQLNREYTNASTTQLVNLQSGDWDRTLLDYLGLPASWFGNISQPGNQVGLWQAPDRQQVPVIAVASHDTASAVIAAPMSSQNAAYLSSGTWSLMGLDSASACTGQQAMAANITNEGGINGRYRVLKNIMGLWLFQRVCAEHNVADIPGLIEQAAQAEPFRSLINPNDDRFLNPDCMEREIRAACRQNNQPLPESIVQITRCIFDSLALLYRKTLDELTHLHGRPLEHLHIVGGGSQNTLLNQLCADACQIPVSAGPIESSVLGNVGCQLMALDLIDDVDSFRQTVIHNFPLHQFIPRPNADFDTHWRRFCALS